MNRWRSSSCTDRSTPARRGAEPLSDIAQSILALLIGVAVGAALAAAISRRALRRVRAAERRARGAERLAEIGAMTSGLAHEIRNPLSTLALNAELLGEGIEDLAIEGEEAQRLRRRIDALRRETERLRGILEDFLQYAGELRLQRVPTDVREMVDELADFFHPQAEQKGVRLRVDLAEEPLVCDVDVPHLKQAVLNLLLNAVQAMAPQEAGTKELLLRVRRRERDGSEPGACIEVIDTGPGIEAEKLERIFQPYFTTRAGGSGLGLPTSRRIVEAHGGQLDAHSEKGRGTAFEISLPLHAAEAD